MQHDTQHHTQTGNPGTQPLADQACRADRIDRDERTDGPQAVARPLIQVRDLGRTYRTWHRGAGLKEVLKSLVVRKPQDIQALKSISFDIRPGELVGFLGPNGAGKSTTIKILCGVLYPTSGSVEVGGLVPWKDRKRHVARIGAVFGQKSQLIWDIPPLDSFMMNQAIYGIPAEEFHQTLDYLSGLLEVEQIMTKPTRSLSLGERMKCEFIMAMLHRPRIVFLDEPTIGLDVIAKATIRNFIRQMNQAGTTFILTTHDLADIECLASRVIVINHGSLVFDGGLDRLKQLFGDRRLVDLETDGPAPVLDLPGLVETGRKDERHVSWELDTARTSLEDFLKAISRHAGIRDMSLGEVPIERIMTDVYGQGAGTTNKEQQA